MGSLLAKPQANFKSNHWWGKSKQWSKNQLLKQKKRKTNYVADKTSSVVLLLQTGCIHHLFIQVLQRLCALCKELIKMSHRCSGMNLWEENGSNNTLDCINTKTFSCYCMFLHFAHFILFFCCYLVCTKQCLLKSHQLSCSGAFNWLVFKKCNHVKS